MTNTITFRHGPKNAALADAILAGRVPACLAPFTIPRSPNGLTALAVDRGMICWPLSSYNGVVEANDEQLAEFVSWLDDLAPGWRDLRGPYGGDGIEINEPWPWRPVSEELMRGSIEASLDAPGDEWAPDAL